MVQAPLYPAIVGEAWAKVDTSVQRAHLTDRAEMKASGVFEVTRGEGLLASLVARAMRLPPASEATTTHLSVTREGRFETWTRRFGEGPPMVTRQLKGPAGTMEERFGAVRLRFRLHVEAGGLRYDQIGARLGLGSVSVPLPGFLSPRVGGLEMPSELPGRTQVEVEISAPFVGRVVRYEGWIEVQGGG